MRIKWNRHLDGSSSRRQDEETAAQEPEEKKRSAATSSPGIFKIFRRKKNKRGEDEGKTDANNCIVVPMPPPLHPGPLEDDNASISSVATCASQPVTEGFLRDRSASLFSSFRLSLSGSKRKKRKIAPTPSETVLNGPQQNEPQQIDRYSTPDLRKPLDKLDAPCSAHVSLSTSSPSIRGNPKGIPSTSAQSLDVQNSESIEKLKWSNTTKSAISSSSSKLSKSVSFSDCCKDGLIDSLHSDNKLPSSPRAVNYCTAMVEEDSGALESELNACLSDNLRRESGFVDSPSSPANVPSFQKLPSSATDGAVAAAVMTKTEEVTARNSKQSDDGIGDILNGIASEIESYGKENERDKICSAKVSPELIPVTSSLNCDPVNCNSNSFKEETIDVLSVSGESKRYEVHVDLNQSPSVQCIETIRSESCVSGRNTDVQKHNVNGENTSLSYIEKENTVEQCYVLDKSNNLSLNSKLEVLTSELSVLATAKNLSELNCDTVGSDVISETDEDACFRKNNEYEMPQKVSFEKQAVITSDKHVVCHMKIYENDDFSVPKSDSSKVVSDSSIVFENSVIENPPESQINVDEFQKDTYLPENEAESFDKISYSTTKSHLDLENNSSLSKFQLSALNSGSENIIKNCDQKVPDGELQHVYNKCHFQTDQQVPEFELSIMEFEEVCSKYMSRSNPEFSDCSSTIPLYSNSPKQRSALDLSCPFIYPNFHENDGKEMCFRIRDSVSPSPNNLIQQNIKFDNHRHHLQSSCQNLTGKNQQHPSLPSPPKQWNNYGKPIDTQSSHPDDVCTDGVQCTNARGKYLCQELCLEALPTTVMLGGCDLGGIDTPQLSSTLEAFETESGRERCSSIVTGEEQQLSDVRASPEDMISSFGTTISSLNGVLDFSYVSESPGKSSSVLLDSEIRDTYRGPRAICDPLIYSADVAKGLESLGPENYLKGHNFADIRNVGFREVISNASCDYVPTGNGLIEISNPYEDTFILPQDLHKQNLTNNLSVSLPNGRLSEEAVFTIDKEETPISVGQKHLSLEKSAISKAKNVERSSSINDVSEMCNTTADSLSKCISDSSEDVIKENKLTHVEQQKNLKNKNSMIPCRKKITPNIENNKKIESKSKSKKSNSLPRFNKTESHLPVKNNSHRVFPNACKDSGVEQQLRGKRKDSSVVNKNKPNGHCSGISSVDIIVKPEISEVSSKSHCDESPTVFEDPAGDKTTSSTLLDSTCYSNGVVKVSENGHTNSLLSDVDDDFVDQNEPDDSKSILSPTSSSIDNISSIAEFTNNIPSLKSAEISDNISECTVSVSGHNDGGNGFDEAVCPECLHLDVHDHVDISSECVKHQYCSKHVDYMQCSRRSSLSISGMRKTSYTSSRESLSSQLTSSSNRGKSRIPKKQPGTRGAQPSTKGPVRPPMWLSKAELTQEIQRLGTLCEARTKELNRLKMETKHVSVGFDAFAALFKYMVEDLNGLSVPALTADLGKTLKQLELTKQDLAYYEREVEEMKSHHCQELNDLSNKLFEVYQSEVAELNAKHQEEINHLKSDHQNQIELLTTTYDASSSEAKAHHEKMIASLEQEIISQREELQQFQEREIKDLEEKHAESSKLLQEHIEQLQKKCAELKQHSMSMEDAMRKDTDSKLQWVTSAKIDLEKEVESLKAVLEMKNKELHTLRVQNLEMEKQLEELPFAREKIKMLQARAEDLEALMAEKTKLERKLSTENQQMRETYEKESKVNRRLSMENEELQWRLRQAENSLISGSFSEVPELPEGEENAASSPRKSPGPQVLNRSVFFTFVDKDEGTPHSPRSQYKKITPNFSANYKTSPAKSSKSPPAPSPRRLKSHSEPPQPIAITSTPRKVAKQSLNKTKLTHNRQRSGSDSGKPTEHAEVNFSSVTESMASSVSSESSVFEHREKLLDEHKEHIIQSLEILREQRSTESNVDEPTGMEKKWCSDDIKVTGELSNLETEDMSRSAEFSDIKTYYHMTFPVLKESGITDCDIEDGCKNSSSGNSPMKEVNSMHSMSENNIHKAVEASDTTLQVMSVSSLEVSTTVVETKRNSCTESMLSAENVQRKAASGEKTENRWRTI